MHRIASRIPRRPAVRRERDGQLDSRPFTVGEITSISRRIAPISLLGGLVPGHGRAPCPVRFRRRDTISGEGQSVYRSNGGISSSSEAMSLKCRTPLSSRPSDQADRMTTSVSSCDRHPPGSSSRSTTARRKRSGPSGTPTANTGPRRGNLLSATSSRTWILTPSTRPRATEPSTSEAARRHRPFPVVFPRDCGLFTVHSGSVSATEQGMIFSPPAVEPEREALRFPSASGYQLNIRRHLSQDPGPGFDGQGNRINSVTSS